jgi:hypothetical protein
MEARLVPATGAVSHNWSDRPVPDEPVQGMLDVFAVDGRRGITPVRFLSTDPASGNFLKPASDALRVPATDGSEGYVGAVEP